MTENIIYLIGGDDNEQAIVSTETKDNLCHIKMTLRGKTIAASDTDYFEAFCKIRSQLEKDKLIPFCYGASLNVFPSSMRRDMGSGMKAYRFTQGQKPSISDLVNIFDSGHDIIPALIDAQKEFYNSWRKSVTPPSGQTNQPESTWRKLLRRIGG